MGNGICGQFITLGLCHSFRLMLFPMFSGESFASSVVLLSCSSMCPFHGVWSFRSGPLHSVVADPFRVYSLAAIWGHSQAPAELSVCCRQSACFPVAFSMGCRKMSALTPGAPLLLPSLTFMFAGMFLTYFY